jgi:hypothetical protein
MLSIGNVGRIIKSDNMRWTRYVARMGEMRNKFNIFVIKTEG